MFSFKYTIDTVHTAKCTKLHSVTFIYYCWETLCLELRDLEECDYERTVKTKKIYDKYFMAFVNTFNSTCMQLLLQHTL